MAIEIPVVLVRHGRYDRDTGRLNAQGRGDILRTCNRLAGLALGDALLILSSTEPRAEESAKLVEMNLPSRLVTDAELARQGNRPDVEDFDGMLERIAARHDVSMDDHTGLVVVTHAPLIHVAINHKLRGSDAIIQHGEPYPYTPGTWVPPIDLL